MISVFEDDFHYLALPCAAGSLADNLASAQNHAKLALTAPVGRWGWKGVCLGDLIEISVTADTSDPAIVTRLTRNNPPEASLPRQLWRALTGPGWATLIDRFYLAGLKMSLKACMAQRRALQTKVEAMAAEVAALRHMAAA